MEEKDLKTNISEALKQARLDSGMSQDEAAEYIGVQRSTIGNYESGFTTPDIERFIGLCRLYHMNYIRILKDIFGAPNNDSPTTNDNLDEIGALLSTYNNETLEKIKWIFSGKYGQKPEYVIEIILAYLHMDIGSKIDFSEWICDTYSALKLQGQTVYKEKNEPDIGKIFAYIEDERKKYLD